MPHAERSKKRLSLNEPTKPAPQKYSAIGPRVMLGARAICTATSNTMAKRIAFALNNHTPGRRGI
jgi:hypothetical protein